jgi:branched-chain amino acid transport system substrate-binding protein
MIKSIYRVTAVALLGAFTFGVSTHAGSAELRVVQVAHFSGPQAPTANALHSGAKLWFDYVNATGGLGAHKVKFVSYDDQQKVEETVRLAKEAIEKDRPIAFLGAMSTSNTEALIKNRVFADAGVALVGPGSGATSLLGHREVFTIKADYHRETFAILNVLRTIGYNKIALLMQEDAFGQDVKKGFDTAVSGLKLQTAGTVKFKRDLSDMDRAVDDLIKLNPDAIYLGLNTGAGLEFVGKYKARGGAAKLVGMSIVDVDAIRKKFGPDSVGFGVSLVVPNPEAKKIPIVREFHEVRAKLGRDIPSSFRVMEGYIAAKVITEGIRRAGGKPSADSVLVALEGLRTVDLGGYDIGYKDRSKAGSAYVDLAIVNRQQRILQ